MINSPTVMAAELFKRTGSTYTECQRRLGADPFSWFSGNKRWLKEWWNADVEEVEVDVVDIVFMNHHKTFNLQTISYEAAGRLSPETILSAGIDHILLTAVFAKGDMYMRRMSGFIEQVNYPPTPYCRIKWFARREGMKILYMPHLDKTILQARMAIHVLD